jgi:hypothetical protein
MHSLETIWHLIEYARQKGLGGSNSAIFELFRFRPFPIVHWAERLAVESLREAILSYRPISQINNNDLQAISREMQIIKEARKQLRIVTRQAIDCQRSVLGMLKKLVTVAVKIPVFAEQALVSLCASTAHES